MGAFYLPPDLGDQILAMRDRIAVLEQILGPVGLLIFTGSGSPNGAVTASPPAVYLNRAGGANTTLWVKESGAGTNTGWVAK